MKLELQNKMESQIKPEIRTTEKLALTDLTDLD